MANSLSRLIKGQYGVRTYTLEYDVAIAASPTITRFLNENHNRLGVQYTNTGVANIWYSTAKELTINNGAWLAAVGGSRDEIWNEDFDKVGYEHFATGDGGVSSIHVSEIIAYGEEEGK